MPLHYEQFDVLRPFGIVILIPIMLMFIFIYVNVPISLVNMFIFRMNTLYDYPTYSAACASDTTLSETRKQYQKYLCMAYTVVGRTKPYIATFSSVQIHHINSK